MPGNLLEMVGSRQRRHPHDLGADVDGVVHRVRVDAARRVVQRDAGIELHAGVGEERLKQDCVRRAEVEVVLVDQRLEAGFLAFLHCLVVIEDARHRGRAGMAVQVDGAHEQAVDFGQPLR